MGFVFGSCVGMIMRPCSLAEGLRFEIFFTSTCVTATIHFVCDSCLIVFYRILMQLFSGFNVNNPIRFLNLKFQNTKLCIFICQFFIILYYHLPVNVGTRRLRKFRSV